MTNSKTASVQDAPSEGGARAKHTDAHAQSEGTSSTHTISRRRHHERPRVDLSGIRCLQPFARLSAVCSLAYNAQSLRTRVTVQQIRSRSSRRSSASTIWASLPRSSGKKYGIVPGG